MYANKRRKSRSREARLTKTGVFRWAVEVEGPVHWQPAVSGGRVFAGLHSGEILCFETGDALDAGWPRWGGGSGHNGDAKAQVLAQAARWQANRGARLERDRCLSLRQRMRRTRSSPSGREAGESLPLAPILPRGDPIEFKAARII